MLNSRSATKRRRSSSNVSILQPPNKKLRPMHSYKLFTHPKDQQQFESIYNTLHAKLRQIPEGPLQQIAEFAVGTIEKCHNASCDQEIHILLSEKAEYESATPEHSKAPLLGFKYCEYADAHWCRDHMDQIERDPCCYRGGLFDIETIKEKCNDCEGQRLCHDKCWKRACTVSDICNICRHWPKIEGIFCERCHRRVPPESGTRIDIDGNQKAACDKCMDGTVIRCEDCNDETIVGWKGNEYIGRSWSLCIEPKCWEWVCLKCSEYPVCDRH